MIRIVIAEDQRILRGALGTLLDFEEDMKVVGQAENGEQALQLVRDLRPDVCILDIEMPLKSGLEVADELKEMRLSMQSDHIDDICEAWLFRASDQSESPWLSVKGWLD